MFALGDITAVVTYVILVIVLMAKGINVVCGVCIVTYRTRVRRVAFLLTFRSGYDGGIAVTGYSILSTLVTLVITVIVCIVAAFAYVALTVVTLVIIVGAVCVFIATGAVYGTFAICITYVILVAVDAGVLRCTAVIADVVAVVILIGTSICAGAVYGTNAVSITYVILVAVDAICYVFFSALVAIMVAIVGCVVAAFA